jgi:hypothetical protein
MKQSLLHWRFPRKPLGRPGMPPANALVETQIA